MWHHNLKKIFALCVICVATSSTSTFSNNILWEAHHIDIDGTSQEACEDNCCTECEQECGTECLVRCENSQTFETILTDKKKLHSHTTTLISFPLLDTHIIYPHIFQAQQLYISYHTKAIYKPKFQTYSDLVGIILLTV